MATIWGTNPHGLPNRCWAINIPRGDVEELIEKGKAEGWRDLVVDWNPQPRLWSEDEGSASSDTATPRKARRASSSRSAGASRGSATR